MQTIKHIAQRKQQMLEHFYDKLTQAETQEFKAYSQEEQQRIRKKVAIAKRNVEKTMAKAKAKAKTTTSIWGAIGAVFGGAVGFVATGFNPLGAVAGASLGLGVGQVIGGAGGAAGVATTAQAQQATVEGLEG
jgi:hypothetical protein